MKRTKHGKRLFSIPFNGDLGLAEDALASGRVIEVYFADPETKDASNPYAGGPDHPFGRREVDALIRLCRRHAVKTNLLCNAATLLFTDMERLFKTIRSVRGIDAVTLSDPAAIAIFRREFPDKDIQASIIMNLDSFNRVEDALRLGVGSVNVAGSLNRNMTALCGLKRLKKRFPRLKIKLLANHDCGQECIFSPWHYMLGSIKAGLGGADEFVRKSKIYCKDKCLNPLFDRQRVIRIPFIRPEDLAHYEKMGCVDSFKLAYRNTSSSKLGTIYRAYFEGSFAGNLLDLMGTSYRGAGTWKGEVPFCDNKRFPRDFADVVTRCRKECAGCTYCADVAATVFRDRR